MTFAVIAVVALGALLTLALVPGLDGYAAVLLVFITGFGALSLALVRRMRRGSVVPETCTDCGGLLSPFAPYCKHCGVRR